MICGVIVCMNRLFMLIISFRYTLILLAFSLALNLFSFVQIQFIESLFPTQGKLSDKWSTITKAAIAESILNLTRLDEVYRTHENCVKTATLWLALASLCVLDQDHVERYLYDFFFHFFILFTFPHKRSLKRKVLTK